MSVISFSVRVMAYNVILSLPSESNGSTRTRSLQLACQFCCFRCLGRPRRAVAWWSCASFPLSSGISCSFPSPSFPELSNKYKSAIWSFLASSSVQVVGNPDTKGSSGKNDEFVSELSAEDKERNPHRSRWRIGRVISVFPHIESDVGLGLLFGSLGMLVYARFES